jgi:hypothetical protein
MENIQQTQLGGRPVVVQRRTLNAPMMVDPEAFQAEPEAPRELRIVDRIYPQNPLEWFTLKKSMVDKIDEDTEDNTVFTINAFRRANIAHQLKRRIQREGWEVLWEGRFPYRHSSGKMVMATQICSTIPFSRLSVFIK